VPSSPSPSPPPRPTGLASESEEEVPAMALRYVCVQHSRDERARAQEWSGVALKKKYGFPEAAAA